MTRAVSIAGYAALSSAGSGFSALGLAPAGEPAKCYAAVSHSLAEQGFRRPLAAMVPPTLVPGHPPSERARRLLAHVLDELRVTLDRRVPAWREQRVGVILGTSAASMPALTRVLAERDSGAVVTAECARGARYGALMELVRERLGVSLSPCFQVLGACASSSLALGLGARAVSSGHCDLVIAGGYDAHCSFVAAGFEALAATSATECLPFRLARDGMIVGEGAGLAVLVPSEAPWALGGPYLVGFGAASDAHHTTAPEPNGRGLLEAARHALSEAGLCPDAVKLVGAHATATQYNDRAEAIALATLFGPRHDLVIHGPKGTLGHTLGAAGILETLALVEAMRRGCLPATAGHGPTEPGLPGRLLSQSEAGTANVSLKIAAAFGGLDVALVLAARPSVGDVPVVGVRCAAIGAVAVEHDAVRASRHAKNPARLERMDPNASMVLMAVVELLEQSGIALPRRTGLVVGTETATVEANERFDVRRRQGGPRLAEPRRFPATTPNLAAAESSIALGITGPCFAVNSDSAVAEAAMTCGFDLVQSGQSDACLVVLAEEVGPTVEALWATAGLPVPPHGARAALFVQAADLPGLERSRLVAHLRTAPDARTTTEVWWEGLLGLTR